MLSERVIDAVIHLVEMQVVVFGQNILRNMH